MRAWLILALALGCGSSPGTADGPVDLASTDLAPGCWESRPLAESIFYHAYVRSFADSDGDGVGDLPGMIAHLDYVKQLGVDGILVLPVFQDAHPEYGGYGTVDYHHIAADYLGDAAWNAFVLAAHARCLRVAIDLSLTIVSTQHPWFVAAQASPSAPERAHFIRHAPPCPYLKNTTMANGWHAFPDGECFYTEYGIDPPAPISIVSLNVRDPATAEALIQVGEEWLDRGADGFRLDSAQALAAVDPLAPATRDMSSPATHAFWRAFMSRIKARSPSAFVVAEMFDHYSDFYQDGIDIAFDYPIYLNALDAWTLNHSRTGVDAIIAGQLASRPPGLGGGFVSNHDQPRIAERVCPLPCADPTPLRTAAQLLFAMPWVPFVYYGEELGLHDGVSANGPGMWSRDPMLWSAGGGRGFSSNPRPWTMFSSDAVDVATEEAQSDSLLHTYRGLIATRRRSPALTRGGYASVASSDGAVFAFVRTDPTEPVLVLANFAAADKSVTLDLATAGITQATPRELIFGTALTPAVTAANAGAWPVAVPKNGAVYVALPR